ncbi:NADH-quinone oxidoreductase subunit M [Streptomyces sp. SCUT-3]|uniref:complex I subunit 4 family protein n=1 Tax=Streptomyces sp. SCUT-3 TaxID=2684469 RepID=UPI0015FB5C81|nr:NADH-quinone oxidoreductase subunit M [Streptomyces sp. SCUT-3]QMV22828.1 NADH-quinone oxidoreductase subunit M [Streptomyces sp. SCUT-3]
MNDTLLQYALIGAVVLPLLGAGAALLPAPPGLRGRDPEQAVLRHGVTVTGAVLALTLLLAAGFDHDDPARMQAVTDADWIPALGVRLHLGVDGISLPLLVMTALLTFLCALYSYFRMPAGPSTAGFVALLLLLEAGTLATFAVLDLVLFFLAFETVLVPMYFLIARWGEKGRERAAWRFVLFTVAGSVVMLLGLLLVGVEAGTFDMVRLAEQHGDGLSRTVQVVAVAAIGIGLAVKAPMWPLHSWLPDAHTAAPTVGSVLLAGVLLKMGTYGLVRIALPIAPDGAHVLAPYLAAFATVGIVYGSLACLALARPGARGDLKRLIAYSSVGHMGFVLLGIATLTPTGVNGALFANIAHGLITGLLFFLVGAVKGRLGTADLDALAGTTGAALYARAPRLGALLAFAAVASLGLPGLAGFWGEMLALFGAFAPAEGLHRGAYLTFMALAALGTLLTAAYLLTVVRRVCMGDPAERAAEGRPAGGAGTPHGAGTAHGGGAAAPAGTRPAAAAATALALPPAGGPAPGTAVGAAALPDVRGYEFAAWVPLVVLTVLAGLWPAVLLGLTDPAVRTLLGGS